MFSLFRGGNSNKGDEWPQVSVNRIAVEKLEELSQQQMKYDFPDHQLTVGVRCVVRTENPWALCHSW